MAQRKGVIVMHHPDTGREIKAITEKQAEIFARSGWKKGEASKTAAKSSEKKEG